IEILTRTEARRSAWAAALFDDFETRLADPDAIAWSARESRPWRVARDRWRAALLPLDAWGDFHGHITLDHEFVRHLYLLAQLDVERFLKVFDSLPAPEAMTFALEFCPIGEDPELIVELLAR